MFWGSSRVHQQCGFADRHLSQDGFRDGKVFVNHDGVMCFASSQASATQSKGVYCGRRNVNSGDGYCGPNNGTACAACREGVVPIASPEAATLLEPALQFLDQVLPRHSQSAVSSVDRTSAEELTFPQLRALFPHARIPLSAGDLEPYREFMVRIAGRPNLEWVALSAAAPLEKQNEWPLRPVNVAAVAPNKSSADSRLQMAVCVRNLDGRLTFLSNNQLFYCGRLTRSLRSSGQDGFCGPTNGLQCEACVMISRHVPGMLPGAALPVYHGVPAFLRWSAWSHRTTFSRTPMAVVNGKLPAATALVHVKSRVEAIYMALRRAGFIHDLAEIISMFALIVSPSEELALLACGRHN